MAMLPEDVSDDLRLAIDELESAVADMESRLESARAERDEAKARQVELEIENANLRRDLTLALARASDHDPQERQTATADILRIIASSPSDTQPVFDAIAHSANRLIGGFSGAVYRFVDGAIHLGAFTPISPEADDAFRNSFPKPVGEFEVFQLVQSGKPVAIADIEEIAFANLKEVARLQGFRSILYVPLMHDGVAVGVIAVTRVAPSSFAPHQIQLLQTFADQAVIAIENAQLHHELALGRERQAASAEILRAISEFGGDADRALMRIAEITAKLFSAPSVTMRLAEGEEWSRSINYGASSYRVRAEVPEEQRRLISPNLPGTVFRENRQIHVPDLDNVDPSMAHWPMMAARAEGTRTVAGTPLRRDGKPIGALIVFRDRLAPFTDEELALQQNFADQAAIAIENARLFNETQQALERQTATADVLKLISRSAFDLQAVLDTLTESAARLCNADMGAIALRDERGYYHATNYNFSVDWVKMLDAYRLQPGKESLIGRTLLARAAVQIPDVLADADYSYPDMQQAAGYRSLLGVPLMRENEPIGVLFLGRKIVETYSERQVELVSTFADQAVIAIENTRLFTETQEALERQTATADILRVIASSPSDAQPVFDAIAGSAKRLIGGFSAAVFRFVDGLTHLAAFTPTTPAADEVFRATFPRPVEEFDPFQLAKFGRPVPIPDIEDITNAYIKDVARARGFRSMLFVPLMNAGVPIGLISVTRVETGPFAPNHIELLQTFADQAVIAIENTRLFNEVQARTEELTESLQQQTAVGDVLKTISRSTFGLQPVLDTLVNTAALLCNAETAIILRRDGDGYRAAAAVGYSQAYLDLLSNRPLAADRGSATGRAVLEKRPVQILDIAADSEYKLREYTSPSGRHTVLGVPLMREDEPIGVIVLARQRVEAFTQKQIDLVTTFADQAVIAMENVRLFEELQARTRDVSEALTYQTGSADILKVIASSPTDVEPALKAIVENACKLCEAYDSVVLLRQGEDLHFSAHHGPIPTTLERWPINRNWVTGRAFIDRVPVHVHDLLAEGDEFPEGSEMARQMGFRSLVAVPLLREGESIGALLLRRTELQPFSDKQIALLQTFADQAVIAIGNVRLFEEVQAKTHDLEESLQQQTATADVLKVISRSAFDLKTVLDTLIETAVRLGGSQRGGIFFRDNDVLRLQSYFGFPDAHVAYLRENPIRISMETMTGRPALLGETVHIPDILADKDFRNFAALAVGEIRAYLGVPLKRDGKIFGVLGMNRPEPGPFSQRQIELVQTFADQAVIAIENVRLFEEVQAKTRDLSEALEYQTATGDVLNVISRSPNNLQPVMDTIVETAHRLCGSEYALIMHRHDDGFYRIVAHANASPDLLGWLHDNPVTAGDGSAVGIVAADRKTLHLHDALADPRFTDRRRQQASKARTMLAVPLLQDDQVIGVVFLARTEVQPFTERQVDLVTSFADQAVIAISNVNLLEQVQQRTRDLTEALTYQTGSSNILRVIASSPTDIKPVLQAIVESACELCGAYDAVLRLRKGDELQLSAHHGTVPADWNLSQINPYWTAGRAALEQRPIHVHDMSSSEGDEFPEAQARAQDQGHRTILSVPLLREASSIGTLTLRRLEVNPFTDKQVALLQTFADQAVIAIGNVRLFEEVQAKTRDLEKSLQQQTATADVLKVISRSAFDLETVLDALLSSACRLCEADIGTIRYREGGEFRLAATFGCPPEWIEHFRRYSTKPDRSSVFGRTIVEGHVVHIPDLLADPDYDRPEAQRLMGFRAALGVPLTREGETFGVINLFRFNAGSFEDRQIELVQTFADQAVIAIENVRLFDEVQARTRDLSEALTYQTGSANILKVIASSPTDVTPALNAIVESACELCESYDATVTLQDGENLCFSAHHGPIPIGIEKWPINRRWVTGRAFVDRAPIHIHDLSDEAHGDLPEGREMALRIGHRTILAVPLLQEGRSIGVIALRRTEVQPFTDKQIALLQTFADQAVIAIGNVRLFEEVQAKTRDLAESLQFQTASSEVLKVISSSPDTLQPVLDAIVKTSKELCGSDSSTIFLFRDGKFHVAAVAGDIPAHLEYMKANPQALDQPGSVIARVAEQKRTIHVPNVADDPELSQGYAGIGGPRALLVSPLMQDGEILGVITLRQSHLRPFTERQIEAIEVFADQAVIAISNVGLFEEVQAKTRDLEESLQQQTATADVLKVISASPGELAPVFQTLLENAVRLCEAKFGVLFLYEGDHYRAVEGWNLPPTYSEFLANNLIYVNARVPLGRVLETRRPVHVPDLREDVSYLDRHPGVVAITELGGARTLLQVPMLKDDHFVGCIGIYRQEVRPFGDKQIALVQNFGAQAVIAIENAHLLNELRQRTGELTESLQQQTATADVLQVISSSPGDLTPVFDKMLENAIRVCGAEFGSMNLAEDGAMRPVAQYNVPAEYAAVRSNRVFTPHPKSPLAESINTRQVVHVADLRTTEAYLERSPTAAELVELGGARTVAIVPMLRDDEVIGAITIFRNEVQLFSDKQIELLSNFAKQAVIAIENARLLKELRQRTADLSKSLDDLRTAQDRLVQTEKLASLGQLTAGIAHEIKNPLNFVNNFASLSAELTGELNDVLKQAEVGEKIRTEVDELTALLRDNLDKVVQHGKRADSIVKNMLLHSREGSGEHRPSDINALVDESLNLAYHGARAEKPDFNVTLQREFDPAAGMLDVFPQEITRVFLNLVANGFYAVTKRRKEGGEPGFEPILRASTKSLGESVEIRIRDNGIGIPAEVKEKMFNPFFTTKPAGEGTGLGLSMSHDIIVKQHGGTIDVDSLPGHFTEFRIVLPRTSNFTENSRG